MAKLAKKHLLTLSRAAQLWTVQPIVHQGAGMVSVSLVGGPMERLNPSVAHAFGRALVDAAIEAAKED